MEQVRIDFLVTGNMSSLQGQVSALNAELMKVSGSVNMLDRSLSHMNLQGMNKVFAQSLVQSNMFDQQMVSMANSTNTFGKGLENATLSGRKYYTESLMYLKKQKGAISALAAEQIRMQNSVVQNLGKNSQGAMMTNVFTPTGLAKDAGTMARVAAKEWEIFNATAQRGATSMINWGKNTQWAGRQLMVGFTVPLMIIGGLAAKTFKDLDTQLVRLQKVYGSGLTFGDDFAKQSEQIRGEAMKMVQEMASAYGQIATDTASMMADLAAIGLEGEDLMKMTVQTTRLAKLGEVDQQEAIKATIALQSAFKMSTMEVADSVNFLNAVENQTSTTLQDLVEAIPRAGTVVKGLGGDIQDLALYMTAMREGGVSAAEGANGLKSGLSSIIAPSKMAVDFMKTVGIDLPKLVVKNQGDLTGTLIAFQEELNKLDDLARQQVITKLFGKYQFARMNALFNNLGVQGSQTLKVMELMGYSTEQLGQIAQQELDAVNESVSGKWNRAWASFQVTLAQVGETFLKWGTTALNVLNKVFGFIEDHDWLMSIVKWGGLALAIIGPIIMSLGLFGNMIGMISKGVLRLANMFMRMKNSNIGKSFELLTAEGVVAREAMDVMTKTLYDQKTADEVLRSANDLLAKSYQELGAAAIGASSQIESANAQAMMFGNGGVGRDQTHFMQKGTMMARAHTLARTPSYVEGNLSAPGGTLPIYYESLKSRGLIPPTMTIEQYQAVANRQNFGAMGYGIQTAATNAAAGNAGQWFTQSGAKPDTTMIAKPSAQQAAGQNFSSWFDEKESIAKQIQGDAFNEKQWADMRSKALAELNAMQAKETTMLEAVTMQTDLFTDMLRTFGTTIGEIMTALNVRGSKVPGAAPGQKYPFFNSSGSTWAGDTRDKSVMAAFNQFGSSAAMDRLDMAATTAADNIINGSSKMGLAFDKMAQNMNVGVESFGYTESQMVKLGESFDGAATKAKDSYYSFEMIDVKGQKYIVTLDKNGNALKTYTAVLDNLGRASVKLTTSSEVATKAQNRLTALKPSEAEMTILYTEALAMDAEMTRASTAAKAKDAQMELLHAEALRMDAAMIKKGMGARIASGIMSGGKGLISGAAGFGMLAMMAPDQVAGQDVTGIKNVGMGAFMGQMVGSMTPLGPIGGALGGIIVAGAMEGLNYLKERNAKLAAEAAANWESEFSSITLDPQLADQLGIELDKQVQLAFGTSIDGLKSKVDNSPERTKLIGDTYKSEIETMKLMDNATEYARRFMDNMIAAGADSKDAAFIASELLRQAEKGYSAYNLYQDIPVNAAQAVRNLNQSTEEMKTAAFNMATGVENSIVMNAGVLNTGGNGIGGGMYVGNTMGPQSASGNAGTNFEQLNVADYEKAGKSAGAAFIIEFDNAIQQGLIKNPKQAENMFKKQIKEITSGAAEIVGEIAASDVTALAAAGIDTSGKSTQEILSEIMNMSGDARADLLSTSSTLSGPLKAAITVAQRASVDLAHEYRDNLGPEFMATASAAEILQGAISGVTSAFQQAKMAARAANMSDAFSSSVGGMIDQSRYGETQKTNINKLQRLEDKRIQGMQDAADASQQAAQDEIDATEEKMQKGIDAVQKEEDARQKAFDAEQERFRRRQEMRNLEISYREAVAGGDLFEAARIRININATKKQRAAEDANQKASDKADKTINRLEKEKDKKIQLMQDALDAQKKADDEAIASAQKASEQKIKAAEKANEQIAKNEKNMNDDITKLWDLLLNGKIKQFRDFAKELGIDNKEMTKLMTEVITEGFGKLPKEAAKALKDGIKGKDWSTIDSLIKEAILGVKPGALKNPGQLAGNSGKTASGTRTRGSGPSGPGSSGSSATDIPHGALGASYAGGGMVSGPGTSTSDSVPIRASKGEFVVRASAVEKYGETFMNQINQGVGHPSVRGDTLGFAEGGKVPGGMFGGAVQGMLGAAGQAINKLISNMGGMVGSTGVPMDLPKGIASGDIVMWGGEPLDSLTSAQLKIAQRILGSAYSVYQGSFQPQTSYSGTTHTRGGVIDAGPATGVYDPHVSALQRAGFAAWYRGPGAPGSAAAYGAHIHAISLYDKNVDVNAAWQRDQYLAMTGDGLGNPYYGPHMMPVKGIRGMIPGLKAGGRINYDNTLANLHRGESVLTAPLTKHFEDSVARGGNAEYNVNVNVYNPSADVDVERAIENVMSRRERKMGRNRVVK